MRTMDGRDVNHTVAKMETALTPYTDRDWQRPAGTLSWSCWTTAAHVAHDLLAYAAQVAGPPTDGYLPLDLTVRASATPAEVLRVVTTCGRLLASALATADPDTRAWHYGPADLASFAALGVAETLLHTYDITQGLGISWLPPDDLCSAVLHRLVPDAPAGPPARVLLWATGRGELAGHPRVTSWVWRIP